MVVAIGSGVGAVSSGAAVGNDVGVADGSGSGSITGVAVAVGCGTAVASASGVLVGTE